LFITAVVQALTVMTVTYHRETHHSKCSKCCWLWDTQ